MKTFYRKYETEIWITSSIVGLFTAFFAPVLIGGF